MSVGVYAKVAIENTAYHFDKLYSYEIPFQMIGKAVPGVRVMVPFGQGNTAKVSMIFSVDSYGVDKAKPISSVLDSEPVVSKEMLELAQWMNERYFCTLYEAVKPMIPSGLGFKIKNSYILKEDFKDFDRQKYTDMQWQIITLLHSSVRALPFETIKGKLNIEENNPELVLLLQEGTVLKVNTAAAKVKDAVSRMVRPLQGFTEKLTPRQREVYQTLQDVGMVSEKELLYFTGASSGVLKSLCAKGAAEIFEHEVYRTPLAASVKVEKRKIILSEDQNRVLEGLKTDYYKKKGGTALLYGVTGSGKTSIFMKLIEKVRQDGKGVIAMVPEISLTAQTIAAFKAVFGGDIAVFHSGLSLGERMDEWKRVRRGEANIVVGTRSAVFAPIKDIGLIVIDEEQEHTYKSESAPRYDTREVARWRCKRAGGLCLLCSATPSVESAYRAQKKQFSFYRLDSRYGQADLPEVELVDLSADFGQEGEILIGTKLREALQENFEQKQQSIILLNRRGYHTFTSCRACKQVVTCPHCSISLTYHSANNRLMCHYCGYSTRFTTKCPVCSQEAVFTRGIGTQRVEEELRHILPQASILRMDADAVTAKYSMEKNLADFASGEYDVMVGTQMVAKGLDFAKVTLVGVVLADQMLYGDDFRSSERSFDLLTQVVGRAGRRDQPGKAMIQTYMPGNPYLHLAAEQDYFGFYKREILFRKSMLYPPFADILVIGFTAESEQYARSAANSFTANIRRLAQEEYTDLPLRVLPAAPATVARVSNKFRYRIIIKCRNTKRFRDMVRRLLMEFYSDKKYQKVSVYADSNPYNVI